MWGPDTVSLNEKLHDLIESGKTNVVVDLARVKFMNSSGLGMLIGALTTMRKAGGDLRIANASDKIESLLIVTKDRKSTRLNSSHVASSYAVVCLQKKRYDVTAG